MNIYTEIDNRNLPDGFSVMKAIMEFDGATIDANAEGKVSSKALCDYFGSVYGVRPVEREPQL